MLREAIAERYCERGLPTEPDEILVTTGALHAIGLILTTYVQPGDRVLVEQPTYHGALSAIATAGARPVPVAMTDDGWELDAVHAAVQQLSPSLAYLIPDNQNPTGLTMPAHDRKRLADIIAETRTRTIIDETMLDMWLDEPVPAPMAAAMTTRRDLVLTVGSMSKSFWGGLRVGWIRAERATIATIAALRPSIDMGTPILEQFAAARLLAQPTSCFPSAGRFSGPGGHCCCHCSTGICPTGNRGRGVGGMSLWVRLPAPMSTALSAAASRIGLELPAGPAVRGRRHTGALRAGALCAARGPACRRRSSCWPARGTASPAPPPPASRHHPAPRCASDLGTSVGVGSRPCGTCRRRRRRPRSRRG